jgi:hypothetical protein
MDTYRLETSVDKRFGYFVDNLFCSQWHTFTIFTLKSNHGYDYFRGCDGRFSKIQFCTTNSGTLRYGSLRFRRGAQYSMSATKVVEKS